jgi:S-DNA-T family DNA segregation ATPase FtsK/SpoIIIE
VARLLEEVATRRAGAAVPAARTVLLIDGWEAIEDAFESIDHGEPTEELLRLLRDGLSAGITVAVTGGRALTGGRLSALLQQRLVLGMSDPLDLTLAGVSPDAVPVHQGPGRAVEPRGGCEVQIAFHGLSPEREAQDAAVAEVAAALSAAHADLPPQSLPWQIHPLPERVPLDGLSASSPTDLVIGVGGDSLEPLGFDLSLDGRRLLVAGPARSGRSTALLCLAQQLLHHARPLAVITPRRSPLTELGGIPGVHVFRPEDAEGFIALRRDLPELAVLVDDADGLEGAAIESALLETTRLIDDAGGLVAISIDLHRGTALFRGLVPEVARHATGLLLGARSAADGELFRMRVEPLTDRHPGRGLHIVDGTATPIQVAIPDRLTATRGTLRPAAKNPTALASILDPTTAAEDR